MRNAKYRLWTLDFGLWTAGASAPPSADTATPPIAAVHSYARQPGPRLPPSVPLRSVLFFHTPGPVDPGTTAGLTLPPWPGRRLNPGVSAHCPPPLVLAQPVPSPVRRGPAPANPQTPFRPRV